jgi:solute carrier family 25 carnitine/acylcarnitine transporter 20/29
MGDLAKLSGGQNCVLGMVAGMACKSINYPLLSWKNSVQQGLGVSFNPAVVYRGLPMAMLNLGGTTAVQFGTTGFFQRGLAKGCDKDTAEMGGAFLGGLASGVPCSVWELTMIQQQRFGGSIVSTPARILGAFGGAGLLRGLTMTLGRESLFTMAMLGITPQIQRKLVESSGTEKHTALAAGALTGAIFSATLTHPMDTIKTCLQGDLERSKFKTVTTTGQLLVAENGVTGLFKGLSFRISLIATTFFLINNFKQALGPVLYPEIL